MKFKISASVFAGAITPILEVSQKGGLKDFDGLNKINVKVDKNTVSVSAYNGNLAITKNIDVALTDNLDFEFEKEGEVATDAEQLKNALCSFPPGEVILVELKSSGASKELYINSSTDMDQFQTVLCFVDIIDLPTAATVFKKEISVDRSIFLASVEKIKFAFGYEEERGNGEFLYWVMRAKKDFLRFASGTSGVFAILDIEGDSIYSSTGSDFDILFLNSYMPLLLGILSKTDSEKITIKVSDSSNYQIVVSSRDFDIIMLGMNPSLEWIDESTILNKKYPFKVVTSIKDWKYASKGISATYTAEMKKQGQIHKTLMKADFAKNIFTVKSENQIKALRKIKILDGEYPDPDSTVCKSATYSNYILDTMAATKKDGNIQMEFSGETGKKPVFIYFDAGDKVMDQKTLTNTNIISGCTEKFTVFFVQTSF